jgi:hypothetical protein
MPQRYKPQFRHFITIPLLGPIDLDTLTSELVAVVQQTMQPTQASIWLR